MNPATGRVVTARTFLVVPGDRPDRFGPGHLRRGPPRRGPGTLGNPAQPQGPPSCPHGRETTPTSTTDSPQRSRTGRRLVLDAHRDVAAKTATTACEKRAAVRAKLRGMGSPLPSSPRRVDQLLIVKSGGCVTRLAAPRQPTAGHSLRAPAGGPSALPAGRSSRHHDRGASSPAWRCGWPTGPMT